jgi:DNA mismatch repair protein MSH4
MLIDYLSVRNLELVQNLQNPKSPQSLFGVLDHCRTPMGKRLLRANILQPSSGFHLNFQLTKDLNTLEARLDAVQEIIKTEDMYHGSMQGCILISYLTSALKGFQDFDRLLTTVFSSKFRLMVVTLGFRYQHAH